MNNRISTTRRPPVALPRRPLAPPSQVRRSAPADSYRVPTTYAFWIHQHGVRPEYEARIIESLGPGPLDTVNFFSEALVPASQKRAVEGQIREYIALPAHEFEHRMASMSTEQRENYLLRVPVAMLREIQARTGAKINFTFIDITPEEDHAGLNALENHYSSAVDLPRQTNIYKTPDGLWTTQPIEKMRNGTWVLAHPQELADGTEVMGLLGEKACAITQDYIQAIANMHALRHPHILRQLQELMPRRAATPKVRNVVIYGGTHVELSRGASLAGDTRFFQMLPDEFLRHIPAAFRREHSQLHFAFAHRVRCLNYKLTPEDCQRVYLYLFLSSVLDSLMTKKFAQIFQGEDAILSLEIVQHHIASRVIETLRKDELAELWSILFPSNADLDGWQLDSFSADSFWKSAWLGWLGQRYYPAPDSPTPQSGSVSLDPRKFPQMIKNMIAEHFHNRPLR